MVGRRLTAGRAAITALVALAVLAAALPFVHVIALSLSSNSAILRGAVGLLPVEPTLKFYGEALGDITILRSLLVSIRVTVIYSVLALGMTIAGAYPLSKRRLAGRGFFLMLILITMYFSGGRDRQPPRQGLSAGECLPVVGVQPVQRRREKGEEDCGTSDESQHPVLALDAELAG